MCSFSRRPRWQDGAARETMLSQKLLSEESAYMSDREHAIELFKMAMDDFRALEGMQHPSLFGTEFFSDEIFGFHAQQSAEKMLKAWLACEGVTYPRTHDLMDLIHELDDIGANIDLLDELVDLNPFAVQYRYEMLVDDEGSTLDRRKLITQLNAVAEKVRKAIGISDCDSK
jgi:HEPN domain-containing protein